MALHPWQDSLTTPLGVTEHRLLQLLHTLLQLGHQAP